MTIAQKMLDERRIGYLDGVEEGLRDLSEISDKSCYQKSIFIRNKAGKH